MAPKRDSGSSARPKARYIVFPPVGEADTVVPGFDLTDADLRAMLDFAEAHGQETRLSVRQAGGILRITPVVASGLHEAGGFVFTTVVSLKVPQFAPPEEGKMPDAMRVWRLRTTLTKKDGEVTDLSHVELTLGAKGNAFGEQLHRLEESFVESIGKHGEEFLAPGFDDPQYAEEAKDALVAKHGLKAADAEELLWRGKALYFDRRGEGARVMFKNGTRRVYRDGYLKETADPDGKGAKTEWVEMKPQITARIATGRKEFAEDLSAPVEVVLLNGRKKRRYGTYSTRSGLVRFFEEVKDTHAVFVGETPRLKGPVFTASPLGAGSQLCTYDGLRLFIVPRAGGAGFTDLAELGFESDEESADEEGGAGPSAGGPSGVPPKEGGEGAAAPEEDEEDAWGEEDPEEVFE